MSNTLPTSRYLLFSEEELEELRHELGKGLRAQIWRRVKNVADERLAWKIPTEPAPIPPVRNSWSRSDEKWHGIDEVHARRYQEHYRVAALMRNMTELYAFTYHLSGEERYLERAREWLLAPCRWSSWAAYSASEVSLAAYSETDLESMARSGGEVVTTRWDEKTGQHYPVFEDTGIFSTFKLRGVAVGYALLRDKLSPAERELVRDTLVFHCERLYRAAARGKGLLIGRILNHTWFDVAGFGLAALALYDEHPLAPDWVSFARDKYVHSLLPQTLGRDGEYPEPAALLWEFALTNGCLFIEGLRRLTGEDLFAHPHLRRVPEFLLQVLNPGRGLAFDEEATFDAAEGMVAALRPVMLLFAERYAEPLYQWWALEGSSSPPGADAGRYYPGGPWFPRDREYLGYYELLWYRPELEVRKPSRRQASAHLRDVGWAILRSGWSAADTYIAFKSGPFLGPHDKLDQNKFVLSAHGQRLVEKIHLDCYNHSDFFRNTFANSTILVDGVGQDVERRDLTNYPRFVTEYKRRDRSGTISGFETQSDCDYVVGDASAAYRSLETFRRHLLFAKPNLLLIVDELRSQLPRRFDWLLHTRGALSTGEASFEIVKEGVRLLGRVLARPHPEISIDTTPPDFDGACWPYLRLSSPPATDYRHAVLLMVVPDGSVAPSVEHHFVSDEELRVVVEENGRQRHLRIDTRRSLATVYDEATRPPGAEA